MWIQQRYGGKSKVLFLACTKFGSLPSMPGKFTPDYHHPALTKSDKTFTWDWGQIRMSVHLCSSSSSESQSSVARAETPGWNIPRKCSGEELQSWAIQCETKKLRWNEDLCFRKWGNSHSKVSFRTFSRTTESLKFDWRSKGQSLEAHYKHQPGQETPE